MKKQDLLFIPLFLVIVFTSCQTEEVSNTTDDIEVVDTKRTHLYFNEEIPLETITIGKEEFSLQRLDDKYLCEGDMLLTEEELKRLHSPDDNAKGNLAPITWANVWPNGDVYYQFDLYFPEAYRSTIRRAMQNISSRTGVTFRYGRGNGNYINIFKGNGNYSRLGMVGGRQPLSLERNNVGVAMHELGHALGLAHEHARADRDNFIYVHPNYVSQHRIHGYRWGWFDWSSIMLYPSSYKPSIRTYDMVRLYDGRPFNNVIESGIYRLSSGDVSTLNYMY